MPDTDLLADGTYLLSDGVDILSGQPGDMPPIPIHSGVATLIGYGALYATGVQPTPEGYASIAIVPYLVAIGEAPDGAGANAGSASLTGDGTLTAWGTAIACSGIGSLYATGISPAHDRFGTAILVGYGNLESTTERDSLGEAELVASVSLSATGESPDVGPAAHVGNATLEAYASLSSWAHAISCKGYAALVAIGNNNEYQPNAFVTIDYVYHPYRPIVIDHIQYDVAPSTEDASAQILYGG